MKKTLGVVLMLATAAGLWRLRSEPPSVESIEIAEEVIPQPTASMEKPQQSPTILPAHIVAAGPARAAAARKRVEAQLKADLVELKLQWGAPVFLRALKAEGLLEVFVLSRDSHRYELFRSYPIAKQSGAAGPKLAEGDGQVPEGFYYADRSAMKSDSAFHLAINCGYPNSYDKKLGRTGSFIMIHGNCVSVGCLAMTDEKIEEIYSLCDAALLSGQPFFRIHFFPFRMTEENMAKEKNHPWYSFWQNLQEGYHLFEMNGYPPDCKVEGQRYTFEEK